MTQPYLDPFGTMTPGELSPKAALQQAALLTALYWNRPLAAKDVFSLCGGAQLLAWRFQEDSLPPSYFIARNGNNVYMVIAGTTNFDQVISHLSGLNGRAYGVNSAVVHTYFHQVAVRLFVELANLLPPEVERLKLSLSGHSYGGAVAQLLANEAIGSWQSVEVITFGQPRALSKGYRSEVSQLFRIVADGDPVPEIPQKRFNAWVKQTTPVAFFGFSPSFEWAHYGGRYELSDAGRLSVLPATDSDPDFALSLVGPDAAAKHAIGNYLRLLAKEQENSGRGGANDQVAKVAVPILATQPEQINVILRPTEYVDLNALNSLYFPGVPGVITDVGLLLAESITSKLSVESSTLSGGVLRNNQLVQGENGMAINNVQAILFIDQAGYGASEAYYYKAAVADLSVAMTAAEKLAKLRSDLFGENTQVQSIRVSSNPDVNGDSMVKILGPQGMNKSFGALDDPQSDNVALAVRIRCEAGGLNRSVRTLVGVPDAFTKMTDRNTGKLLKGPTDANWLKAFDKFAAELIANWGYFGKIKTVEKKDVTAVTNIVGPPLSYITLRVPGHGYANNDKIRVSKFAGVGVKPNGTWHINRIDADTFALLGYEGNFAPTKMGKTQVYSYGVQPFTTVQLDGFTSRHRGPAFRSAKRKSAIGSR